LPVALRLIAPRLKKNDPPPPRPSFCPSVRPQYHHLLIMESLGGDQPYWVRFLAQHSALAYYIALCILWMLSPSLSYKFSELLEAHAVDTYGQFVDENEMELRSLPPSLVAVEYYTIGLSDPLFGEYQTASVMDPQRREGAGVRKPGTDLRSLYDVFVAIRNDEGDHVQTMTSCLDPSVAVLSPALESRVLTGVALAAGANLLFGGSLGVGGGVGLNGIEGVEGLADMADGMTDLESILAKDGSIGALNAIFGGLAGLANGMQVRDASLMGGCYTRAIRRMRLSFLILFLLLFPLCRRNCSERGRRLTTMLPVPRSKMW